MWTLIKKMSTSSGPHKKSIILKIKKKTWLQKFIKLNNILEKK